MVFVNYDLFIRISKETGKYILGLIIRANMHKLRVDNFNLKATVESGQIFRWEKLGGWYYITVGTTIIKIRQKNYEIIYSSSNNNFDVLDFFDLKNPNYDVIIKKLRGSDKTLTAATKKYNGLRLIKQQPWECTASFICSSYSNIKRIKKNLNSIAEKYGEKIEFDGYTSYSFPTAAAMAGNIRKLNSCGLGYRTKYLASTAKIIDEGFNFEKIRSSSYDDAKKILTKLDGVGEKVADCILLFSLGFSEAFPVDVWMMKIMKNAQVKGHSTPKKIAEFSRQKYGMNAGYAQQFLYHYARNGKI